MYLAPPSKTLQIEAEKAWISGGPGRLKDYSSLRKRSSFIVQKVPSGWSFLQCATHLAAIYGRGLYGQNLRGKVMWASDGCMS